MQQRSYTVLNGELSFQLSKVSIATDAQEVTKFSWNHRYSDLEVRFDNYGSSSSNRHLHSMMHILQLAAVVERVDLYDKIEESNNIVEHCRRSNVQLKVGQIPTSLIYRKSDTKAIIAIKYPLPGNKIRRVQLTFLYSQDVDTVLDVFHSLGCHIQQHETRPENAPPGTAGSTSSRIEPVDPTRPLSASAAYSRQPFHSHTASHFHDNARPSSSLFPIQEHEPSNHSDSVMQNIGGIHPSTQRSDPLRGKSIVYPRNVEAGTSNSQSDPAISKSVLDIDSIHTAHSRFLVPSSFTTSRPSTAPMKSYLDVEAELNIAVPPRRELPFKRPDSKHSTLSREESSSRPSTSTDLPPLPKPSYIRPMTMESANQSKKTVDASAASPRRPAPAASKVVTKRPSSATTTSTAKRARPSTPASGKPSATKAATTKLATAEPTSSKLPAKAAASSRPSSAITASSSTLKATFNSAKFSSDYTPARSNQLLSSSSIFAPIDTDPTSVDDQAHTTDLSAAFSQIGAVMTPASAKEDLAAYAALPHQTRMAAMEGMIIAAIEDDNFATLCEDVYGSWKKIGLEL